VRRGDVETLKEAGSKGLGIRVFVGQRTASSYTSDFSWPALQRLVEETVGMARVTGEDAAAGLPEETVPPEDVDLALHDPSPAELPTEERIRRARAAEAVALETAGITNSQGATWGSGEGSVLLANTNGFLGSYRSSSVSLSVVPQAERDGQKERDYRDSPTWSRPSRSVGPRPSGRCGVSGPGRYRPARCRWSSTPRRRPS
jgi:PmbA protein